MNSIQYTLRHCPQNKDNIVHSHFHNDIEILLPLSDGASMSIDSKVYPIRRGTLFVMQEHTLHNQLAPVQTYDRFILHVDPKILSDFSTSRTNFSSYLDQGSHAVDVSEKTECFIRLFDDLLSVNENLFGADVLQIQCFLKLMVEVCAEISKQVEVPQATSSPDITRIMEIQAYIQQHMTEQITLDTVAKEFYLSKYYLSHLFKENTNYGIIEYVNYCRISKASQLLRNGLMPSVAGEQVGFQSHEHFVRTFKGIVGTTPNQYYNKYGAAIALKKTN